MSQTVLKIGLMVVFLGLAAQEANAFGRCGGRGYGYGYGGYGGCGYGGYGYGGYGYGGYGGYGYGSYRGYGYGGYGGWGYGGYSSPVVPSRVSSLVSSSQPISSESVRFTVSVPADAKVFVNGIPTRSTGEVRQYASTGVQPSAVYPYQVRAEFVREGKLVSEEKTIQLTAGQTGSIEFGTAPTAQAAKFAPSTSR
jgi:uncharacterized protein (TIGR03000 family)